MATATDTNPGYRPTATNGNLTITLNPQSDLTATQATELLMLIDTTEKRQRVLNDLCTLRALAEPLFIFPDSPHRGDFKHPLFKIMTTANELISILLKRDERLTMQHHKGGCVVVVETVAQES